MGNKKVIGVMGTSQIKHIIPVLEREYTVINLQEVLETKEPKIIKHIRWITLVNSVDILYNIYTSNNFWKKVLIGKIFRKKVITHWIGTDVYKAINGETDIKKIANIDLNFVCFDGLREELDAIGMKTNVLPIIPFNFKFAVCKMPVNHAVLIYMPTGKEEFYGFDELKKVFLAYPKLKFVIIGNVNKNKFLDYQNVNVEGVLNLQQMENLYENISIIIRLPKHDGLSMSVIEALAKGKKVIWNYAHPYSLLANNAEEISEHLNKLLEEPPNADCDAHKFIINEYTEQAFLRVFNRELERISHEK